jgi:hypothetical protein
MAQVPTEDEARGIASNITKAPVGSFGFGIAPTLT